MNLLKLFRDFQGVLEKHKEELYHIYFYPEHFRGVVASIVNENEQFSYSPSPIKITLPKEWIPNHTLPDNLANLEVTLDIKDEVKIKRQNASVEDPLKQLVQFNIIINSGDFTSSWHLDRHVKQAGDGQFKHIHPIYHWTFGGYHIETEYRKKHFGAALFMRSPRLMYPPMDLILGLDFIFNHFIPSGELALLDDVVYKKIISDLKNYLWKPFALAFAKNYCNAMEVDNERLHFDDLFVQSVIGIP